ncbi:MAG: hypothetical protein ACREJO_14725 [Phycisphaerales bacterium]
MTQALTRYNALYSSLRARAKREAPLNAVDRFTATLALRVRARRTSLGWLRKQAELIDAAEPEIKNYSEAALDDAVTRTREVFIRGHADDETVRRGFALVREIARRDTGQEAYLVQLIGALALYHGRIIEMLTGEGKTLTGSIVAPLIAWRRRHLHVLTVNDYLASRDAESRAGIYKRCHLECGAIVQELDGPSRFRVYAMPIVYGTPKQITADFLRDQIRLGATRSAWTGRRSLLDAANADFNSLQSGTMIPGLHAALVDEADAVLIDEGVTPLIIAQSRRADDMAPVYARAAVIAGALKPKIDFQADVLRRRVDLTKSGIHHARRLITDCPEPIWRADRRALELIRQALVAGHCYKKGAHYLIADGRIVIVDEYTGRVLTDRNWEHGLHQAVEAKEGVEVTADRETLARLSFQRFFRMYPFLCGMTGTAADATGEMVRTYLRPVSVIPTNRPVAREQWPTRVFRSSEARWSAVVESIAALHRQGRPVLAGTRSVYASELLSTKLAERNLTHKVLNANFDKDEASLISNAGEAGAITVATNMAGRGTDILLDHEARQAGGLHVLLTEMHGAKRIDRQFIGRAGRQGDPGSAQMFLSLEDELVKLHTPRAALVFRGSSSGEELKGKRLRLARALFRFAQRRSEARDRRNRAEVLKQDDWIEKHLPGT